MAWEKCLAIRPPNFLKKVGEGSKICAINSRPLFQLFVNEPIIFMACNVRIKFVFPGILRAAMDLDAVLGFELAKSEGDVDGGYTGQTPEIYADTILEYVEKLDFRLPFFIHGDHITVKSTAEKDVEGGRRLIEAEIKAGYTSFAIDASFNKVHDNIGITTELAKPIMDLGIGLEAEVGEIKSKKQGGEISTVEESLEMVEGLRDNGIKQSLLAVNNGSQHGNYDPGQEVHIDLERTGEIFEAIKKYDIAIAQHGITGTPIHLVSQFADHGIRKGNVATHWQNIGHEHLPPDLMQAMKDWAEKEGKGIKFTTRQFKKEIDSIPEQNRKAIKDHAYQVAKEFIEAFRAKGTATRLESML